MFRIVKLALIAISAFLSLVGCKASEAPRSAFLDDPALMAKYSPSPYQHTYWDRNYDKNHYTEIMIRPVYTQYVMAQNFWESMNLANLGHDKIKTDIANIADYTHRSFTRAFADDPLMKLTVVQKAGPKTLILELAITQLVPSKVALNAAGYYSWIPTAVGFGGSILTDSPDSGKGYVAIEGRVRDGGSGAIIGMFADRENPKMAIIDLKSLTWWEPAKAIIDDWSRQLVALANRKPGETVKDSPIFSLLVW